MLEVAGIDVSYGETQVLFGVSLTVARGEIVCLLGPNGAGKTTCFNVLTGGIRPDRGRVVFGGEDITGLPPYVIARRGVARSFQLMNVFDEYSALENVLLAVPAVRAHSFDMVHDLRQNTDAQDRAATVLARVGLRGKERVPAGRLSYGDRRALEIGLAVAAEPRLLFLDEPTSGLGADGTARLAELVQELRRVLTIVIIEHDMAFLFRLADRISVIHWGQVIAEGSPDALRANPWVQRSNLGAMPA